MDPTLIAGAMGALGQAAAGGPSSAESGIGSANNFLDGSGWTVSTGQGKSTGATIVKSDPGTSPMGGAMAAGLAGFDVTTVAMLAIAAVVAIKVLKR